MNKIPKEQAVLQIIGSYMGLCRRMDKGWLNMCSERRSKLMIRFNAFTKSEIIGDGKKLLSFLDGYGKKERDELFDLVIMYAGFTTIQHRGNMRRIYYSLSSN